MIKIDKDNLFRFKKEIKDCFRKTVDALDEMQDDLINDPWGFSDLGFTDQDIVDSGDLRDSKVVEIWEQENDIEVTFSWNPVNPDTGRAYAGDVLTGFYSYSGKFVPGRDWPNKSEQNLDTVEHFKNVLRSHFE
jgi:hypothetical protein